MCLRSDFGIVACWCMFAQVAAGAPPPPTTATRTFLDADINRKGKIIGNRLTALYGGQLASAPGGATAAFVQTFVDNNKYAFGVSGVDLVFKSAVTIAAGKRAVYTYTQRMPTESNLEAHRGVVTIVVQLGINPGTSDIVSYVSMHLLPHPSPALPADTKTEQDARNAVTAAYPHINTFGPLTKLIYEEPDGTLHRAYRFNGSGGGDDFLFFVDTNSAQIVGIEGGIAFASLSGTVRG